MELSEDLVSFVKVYQEFVQHDKAKTPDALPGQCMMSSLMRQLRKPQAHLLLLLARTDLHIA